MAYYASGYNPTTAYISVRKAWDTILHTQTQNSLFFRDMIGRDKGGEGSLKKSFTNYPIVEKTQLGKESGDRITMTLRRQLVTSNFHNAGKSGNTQLVDSETAMSFYNTYVYVSHWRDATAILGKLTMKRTPFELRREAVDALTDEVAQFLDSSIFFTLYSGFSPNVVREVGVSTLTESLPLNNLYGKNQSAVANITASDVLDTEYLEMLAAVASANNFNHIRHNGKDCGLLIVHPYSLKTLRADSLYQDANNQGMPRDGENTMFSRAEGRWSNIYVAESNKVDSAKNYGSLTVSSDAITIGAATINDVAVTDVRMNVFLGANAVARAVALPEYMEARKEDDYGNIFGWGAGLIFGDRRTDYTIDDGSGATTKNQSSICCYSYAPTIASNFSAIWS